MNHKCQIEIKIRDSVLNRIHSFKLHQAISVHHQFEIICPKESVNDILGTIDLFDTLLGLPIQLKLTSKVTSSFLLFMGIVTRIQVSPFSGQAGEITINGYSPTIIMDSASCCKSWERKVLKNIARDVMKQFPLDKLQTEITSAYPETLPYTVQYNETAWQFLNRLTANYGEWLYYEGQHLVIGLPKKQTSNLIYGINLSQFEIFQECLPILYRLLAYDYMHHQVYIGNSEPDNSNMLQPNHQLVVERSNVLYSIPSMQWHSMHVTNKKQLDNFIGLRKAGRISGMVKCFGSSTDPALQPGSKIRIVNNGENHGEFIIVSVRHLYDKQNNYNNKFEAVPASVRVPPIQSIIEPRCETQSALVVDNDHKKGLRRVRVRFYWMNDNEKSPWLPVVQPQSYGDKEGYSVMLPFIGQEVMVAFQGDHPDRPYILGVLFKGNDINNLMNGDKPVGHKEEQTNISG